MALSKINSNLQTNQTWRGVVDAGIDLLNSDILQATTTITVHALNDVRVTGHHTINYTSSNALQDAISALPKNMSGHSLTIQFQDGTYDFGGTQIKIWNFSGGVVFIQGNQSNSGSGTYNVILQGQNSGGDGIFYCKQCQDVIIQHLEFQHTGSGNSNYLLKSQVSNTVVYRCKFTRTATVLDNSRGIYIFDNCNARVVECNFSSLNHAIYAQQNSNVLVRDCHDFGTQPVNGMTAVKGAIIKPSDSVIDSSSANFVAEGGGLITHKSGIILEETILTSHKTVNIVAGSSASTIQGLINDQPKNLNGYKLTFTFQGSRTDPQEYDLGTTILNFDGFHGGEILVQGNSSETPTNRTGFVDISSASLTSNVVTINTSSAHGLSTGDTVYLQNVGYATTSPNGKQTSITVVDSDTFTFALTGANETYTVTSNSKMNALPPLGVKILTQNTSSVFGAMQFSECTMIYIEHLHFEHNGTATNSDILSMHNGTYGTVQYCIVANTNTKGNEGISYSQSLGQFKHNRVSNLHTVVKAHSGSHVLVRDIDLLLTAQPLVAPNYKLLSQGGSVVTQSGTEFVPTIGHSVISDGGVVMPLDGIIFDETILQADKTVNFDNSMSISTMQGLIDAQPKNLNGYGLTFKFADGTYNFGTSGLNFENFSSGEVLIKGDTQTLNADGSGLDVTINCSRGDELGAIYVSKTTKAFIQFIKFVQNGTNTNTKMVRIIEANTATFSSCSFQNTGTQGNDAIHIDESRATVTGCKFDNFARNIIGFDNSKVWSNTTATYSGGTDASTANLYADTGSIMTQTSTQAGGGNVKAANSGAVIFNSSGALV